MGDIAEWLQRCQSARVAGKGIPAASLFRRMIEHDAWLVAESHPVLGEAGTASVYCASSLPESEVQQRLNGLQLAAALAEDVVELHLYYDRASPPLVCDAGEAVHFRSFLKVTVVEGLLQRLFEGADMQVEKPFARLREFDEFFVLCAGGHGSGSDALLMALAPDPSGGRKLAAAFTAEDALQLFVVSGESDATREAISVRLSGSELFGHIAKNKDLDGLVFNPSGPGQPIALSAEAAHAVMADGG